MRFLQFLIQLNPATVPADTLKNFDIERTVDRITSTPLDVLLKNAGNWFLEMAIKVAICLVIFWLAKKTINFFSNLIRKIIDKRRVDPTVSHFLMNFFRVIYWIIIAWILISILGVNTASIVAMFASAGLAFGLALSGTLQNLAGGIMILLFKPFRVGDYISSQGEEGTVTDITIINTILNTPDNRTIYLPNGATFTGIVRNTSNQNTRRVEWTFNIGYGDSYDRAKKLLFELIGQDTRILTKPEPFVALSNLAESSVDIVVRVWVKSGDFWGVFYDLNEQVYKSFPANGLSLPFPQMDVYMHSPEDTDNPSEANRTTEKKTVQPPVVTPPVEEPTHCENNCDESAKPSGGESK